MPFVERPNSQAIRPNAVYPDGQIGAIIEPPSTALIHPPRLHSRPQTVTIVPSSMTNPGIRKPPHSLSASQRRRAWNMAYCNVGLWAVGNGLTSSTLVIYLALELDAPKIGLSIGLILAMRHLVGVLRLATPVLIGRIADRKTFCQGAYLLSGLLLLCLPVLSAPGMLRSAGMSLAALVILWTLHHLIQYLATIALFSWLADIAPLVIRGRFFGFRERWLVAGIAKASALLSASGPSGG